MKKPTTLTILGVFITVGCGLTTQFCRVWPSMEILLLVYCGILLGVTIFGFGIVRFVKEKRR